MRASQRSRPQCINPRFQYQLGHVAPAHAFLLTMCIFMLPMLVVTAEHVQLATTDDMNPVDQWCIHPHHTTCKHAPLMLPSLNNILPAMALQNEIVKSNIWCLSRFSSGTSVHRVSSSPGYSVPSGLGRMVVGAVVVLLLLMSGDIEMNPGPVGNKLTSDNIGCVLEEVLDVSAKWYRLGLQLKVRIGTLDSIRTQFQDPKDQLLEMLKTWLTSSDNTSWKTLTDALRSRSVGASQLAEDLETKYCMVEPTEADIDEKPTMPLLLSFPGNINIAQQIGTTYTVFGTLLLNDDNQERVTALARQFGNEASEVNMAILREWLWGSGVKPVTWSTLVEVLKKCRLDLAEKIESRFKCTATEMKQDSNKSASRLFTPGRGNKLTLDDLGQVMEEVLDVSAQWYHLGLQLKLRAGTLDRIRALFSDPKHQLLEVLKTWLTTSENTHWKTLIDALRSRAVGASQLADVLEKKCFVVEPTEVDIGTAENQRQFNKAMQYGHVEAWLSKMLLYGAAGSGKTCTNNMIAGNPPPENRHSTPLAVRPATVYRVSVEGKEWTKVTTQQERKSFLARMLFTFVPDLENRLRPSQQEAQTTFSSSNFSVLSEEPNHSVPKENSQHQSSSVGTDDRVAESKFEDKVHNSALESITTDKELVEMMGQMSNTTDPLSFIRILHIIDSGGQPQFHEILPIFLRQLSFYVFVFRLDIALDSRPEVELYVDGKQVGTLYTSAQTIEQLLQHCVRTMHSHGAFSGEYPQIIVVGTHADKMKESLQETLKQTNEKISKILSSLLKKQIVYSKPCDEEVVFPVNAALPGRTEKDIVDQIREILLGEESIIKPVKIPLKWFGLEVLLKEMAQTFERGVFSKEECLAAAKDKLFFEEDSFNAAIVYLHELSVLFHYPDILPDVVFADAQVLLDKVTELVVKAYEIERLLKQKQQRALSAEWKDFHDFARVDVKFLSLKEFKKHYVQNIFEPQHLVHLFKKLFIFASINKTELFVPCLLQSLDDGKVNKLRVQHSSPFSPLVIKFPEGGPRKGVFCSLICFLTSDPSRCSILLKHGASSPVCLYRNCIQFDFCPGWVTLIDAYTHFEVHVQVKSKLTDEVCHKVCQRIYNTIWKGVITVSNKLRYYESSPTLALFCPCGIGKPHIAKVDSEIEMWICSEDSGNCNMLTEEQKCLIRCQVEKDTCNIKTLLEELTDISGSDWFNLGIQLGVEHSTLRNIEGNHRDVQRCKTEMLHAWLQSGPRNPWMKLGTTLECMGNKVLGQKILEKYTTLQ